MTGALCIVTPGSPIQLVTAISILATHMIIVLKLAPYQADIEDWMSFISSLALVMTTFGGLLLIMDGTGEQAHFNSHLVGVILLFINGIVMFLNTIFVCMKWKNKSKAILIRIKTFTGKRTQVVPVGGQRNSKNGNKNGNKNDKNGTYDDWNDASDTSNVAKIMQDGQAESHDPGTKTNENEPVAPVIPLEESTLWKQREEVKAAREAATAKRDF